MHAIFNAMPIFAPAGHYNSLKLSVSPGTDMSNRSTDIIGTDMIFK